MSIFEITATSGTKKVEALIQARNINDSAEKFLQYCTEFSKLDIEIQQIRKLPSLLRI